MHKFRNLYGILNALPIFECAARHMSFTKAASELNLSQPAVSRRITNLELQLGVALFKRTHNTIKLTPAGIQLNDAATLSLSHLNAAILKLPYPSQRNKISIACGFSFATMWLQPRFSKLRDELDDIEIHLIASEFLDELNPDMIDIRVLWENNPWPDRIAEPFFPEDVCPVCSPGFAKKFNLDLNSNSIAKQLINIPLLYYGVENSGELDWTSWFVSHGIDYASLKSNYLYDNYQFLIQAAIDGEGVALGNKKFINSYVEQKILLNLGPYVRHRDHSLLLEFDTKRISPRTQKLIYKWFKNQLD